MSDLLTEAMKLASRGFPVFPLTPRDKHPLPGTHGFKDATTDPVQILAWWAQTPDANIGLATGRGMFVLDLDSYDARASVEAAGVVIPEGAPAVVTGKTGAAHIYLAGDAPSRAGILPKVDTRGEGGYVVAPPSIHPSGAVYTWAVPLGDKLPAAPPSLMALIGGKPAAPAPAPADWLTQALTHSPEGTRDINCTKIAGYLLGKGVPEAATDLFLQAWAQVACDPPFDQVSKCVASIAKKEGEPAGPPEALSSALDVAIQVILSPKAGRPKPASTSLRPLDNPLGGGLYPGEYGIKGARPGIGKTAMALQGARQLAKSGVGVLFVSLEMTKTALVRRLLSQETGVRAKALKTGDVTALEIEMLRQGSERLRHLPLWITTGVRTVEQLVETVRAYEPGQLGMVYVDYLQLLGTTQYMGDTRQRVGYISKSLRALTIQTEIPLWALSQLSRPPKDHPNWRPRLSDLKESGDLEADADVVLLLHRDEGGQYAEANLAKNRDGEPCQVVLAYDGSILTFREVPS